MWAKLPDYLLCTLVPNECGCIEGNAEGAFCSKHRWRGKKLWGHQDKLDSRFGKANSGNIVKYN
jgi:hypothetical protein